MASTNGMLAGLVAITAGAPYVDTTGALALGAVGGFAGIWSNHILLYKFKIDDPVGVDFGCQVEVEIGVDAPWIVSVIEGN